jgi:hypothetical protein
MAHVSPVYLTQECRHARHGGWLTAHWVISLLLNIILELE